MYRNRSHIITESD